jgi:hypothetical protein
LAMVGRCPTIDRMANRAGGLTPEQFVEKWTKAQLSERAASHEHFLDLCHLLGQPTPAEADATGHDYCFEKHVKVVGAASKGSKGDYGFVDVWKRGHFAWEYKGKGKHKTLDEAYAQVYQFRPVHPVKKGWKLGDPPGLPPLYRADELPAGDTVVWVCEGEKAADADHYLQVTDAHFTKAITASGKAAQNPAQYGAESGRNEGYRPIVETQKPAVLPRVSASCVGLLAQPVTPTGIEPVSRP